MAFIVSKTEKTYLAICACFVSLLSLCNIAVVMIYPILYPPPFEIYEMARSSLFPPFRFLILFIPFTLVWPRRFFLPTLYTLIALLPAYIEFVWKYHALTANYEYFKDDSALRILLLIANPGDYITFVLSNLIFLWIGSIFVRNFTIARNKQNS